MYKSKGKKLTPSCSTSIPVGFVFDFDFLLSLRSDFEVFDSGLQWLLLIRHSKGVVVEFLDVRSLLKGHFRTKWVDYPYKYAKKSEA